MCAHFWPPPAQVIHHRVTNSAIATQPMTAYHTLLFRAQALNGTLACVVDVVGAPAHHVTTQRIERMCQQQQLAGGIDMGTLRAFGVPSAANFQPFYLRQDIVIAGRAQHGTAGFIAAIASVSIDIKV